MRLLFLCTLHQHYFYCLITHREAFKLQKHWQHGVGIASFGAPVAQSKAMKLNVARINEGSFNSRSPVTSQDANRVSAERGASVPVYMSPVER